VRPRLAIVIGLGGLALAAPEALGQSPTLLSPPNGAEFQARPGQITFEAFSSAEPAEMEFYVSDNTNKNEEGVLSDPVDVIVVGSVSGEPTEFVAQPDESEDWPLTPGTYHWQAVYQDCGQGGDCSIESPIRSLTVTRWENPPDALLPENGTTVEARPDQITFRGFTNAGPASMQFYVSEGTRTDADGVLANEVDIVSGFPMSGQPGRYQGQPASGETWPRTPDTYHWQPVYFDCDESADCFNEGPIRTLTVVPWSNPPIPIAPADDASLTARADQVTFRASGTAAPSQMRFYVSQDTETNPEDGILTNFIDMIAVGPSGQPPVYVGQPASAEVWPETPGTYYWQAVYHDCDESADCWNEGPVRRLTIAQLPPPTQLLPLDGATIAYGGLAPFTLRDPDYARAGTTLRIEFATDDQLDPDGTFADANRIVVSSPLHVEGSTYAYQLSPPHTRTPGTYYWMVYREDDLAEADGIVTNGQVRSFTVAEPSGPRPNTILMRHPPKRTHKRRATFTFRSNIPRATFQCFYKGQGWIGCDSPERFPSLRPGRYLFAVRAIANGKRDKSPARWVFTILP
jgi:hypothetical protein